MSQSVTLVASDEQLKDPTYYEALCLAIRKQDIPRREWLDAIADAFRDYDGEFRYLSGKVYEVPLVDDVFGDDPDMRWMGYFLEANNGKPASMSRKFDRLRVLDVYCRLKGLLMQA